MSSGGGSRPGRIVGLFLVGFGLEQCLVAAYQTHAFIASDGHEQVLAMSLIWAGVYLPMMAAGIWARRFSGNADTYVALAASALLMALPLLGPGFVSLCFVSFAAGLLIGTRMTLAEPRRNQEVARCHDSAQRGQALALIGRSVGVIAGSLAVGLSVHRPEWSLLVAVLCLALILAEVRCGKAPSCALGPADALVLDAEARESGRIIAIHWAGNAVVMSCAGAHLKQFDGFSSGLQLQVVLAVAVAAMMLGALLAGLRKSARPSRALRMVACATFGMPAYAMIPDLGLALSIAALWAYACCFGGGVAAWSAVYQRALGSEPRSGWLRLQSQRARWIVVSLVGIGALGLCDVPPRWALTIGACAAVVTAAGVIANARARALVRTHTQLPQG